MAVQAALRSGTVCCGCVFIKRDAPLGGMPVEHNRGTGMASWRNLYSAFIIFRQGEQSHVQSFRLLNFFLALPRLADDKRQH